MEDKETVISEIFSRQVKNSTHETKNNNNSQMSNQPLVKPNSINNEQGE